MGKTDQAEGMWGIRSGKAGNNHQASEEQAVGKWEQATGWKRILDI
jgi:hypothetical protein